MFPVLWICGPPGVGKTVTAVAIHRAIPGSGYVDIDQLGMCYPERADDPGRHRLEARNLADVVVAHRAAGRRGLVVSGVIDAARGTPALSGKVALTMCRLRVGDDELARRLTGRERSADLVAGAVAEAAKLEKSPVDARVVDTDGRTVAEIAADCASGWPGFDVAAAITPEPRPGVTGRIVSVLGPAGVGKSTIAHPAYLKAMGSGLTAAYLDLDQIGFGVDPLAVAPAVWRNFQQAGAEILFTVGPMAMPTALRIGLTASRDELLRRLIDRAAGKSWAQPGDPLRGRPEAYLRGVAEGAIRPGPVDHLIDTDGRMPDEVAEEIWAISRRRS